MGFFMQPWFWIVLVVLGVTIHYVRKRRSNFKPEVVQQTDSPIHEHNLKTEYRCRSCPQYFESPNLFYVCPVCQSPVDKYENGQVVDEVNPAFLNYSPTSLEGTLPFIRRDDVDKPVVEPVDSTRKPKGDNVVALNFKALNSLYTTCWLVVSAESGSVAQSIANHSQNFRVLYKKKPRKLSGNRWLVWGKARAAA